MVVNFKLRGGGGALRSYWISLKRREPEGHTGLRGALPTLHPYYFLGSYLGIATTLLLPSINAPFATQTTG